MVCVELPFGRVVFVDGLIIVAFIIKQGSRPKGPPKNAQSFLEMRASDHLNSEARPSISWLPGVKEFWQPASAKAGPLGDRNVAINNAYVFINQVWIDGCDVRPNGFLVCNPVLAAATLIPARRVNGPVQSCIRAGTLYN